jgi:low temperature requirement protein LtrA
MTKQSQRNKKEPSSKKASSPGKNVLLALTLVPLVIGIILIGAWVLDLELLENPQSQVTVGIFFFLLTFTASNAIQNRWRLAAGWGLLAVADLITLAWLNLAAQIVAISAGLIGLGMLGIEFYKQYQQGKAKQASK